MNRELQELDITLLFQNDHCPGSEQHLLMISQNFFKGKGVELWDDFTILL